MRSLITRSAAVTIGIALAASLGACSLLPTPGAAPEPSATAAPTGETVSEACEALKSEVDEVKNEMQQAAAVLNTDTGAAAEILGVAAFRLNYMAEEELENVEVIDVTAALSASITVLSDLLKAAAPDPMNADVEPIDAAGVEVNAAFADFTAVCPEAR